MNGRLYTYLRKQFDDYRAKQKFRFKKSLKNPIFYFTIAASLSYPLVMFYGSAELRSAAPTIFLLAMMMAVIFNLRKAEDANYTISIQKEELTKQKEELAKQNAVIEEKNKDITDSIHYARRIQTAILPKNSFIESLFPQSFVLYKPKDIVSGDFYWTALKNEKKILVAADCTGHGVPGAFMSMMGSTLLNEIVNEKAITSAADILNHLRERLMQTLQQTGADGESKDGMDIALCVIHENKLEFAGANNSFYLIRNGELKEFKGDKQPIGVHVGEQKPFIQHEVSLLKGDNFYILTDGYADQFGGPKGKKFKYKQLEDQLLSISTLSMDKQKEKLDKEFETWKGELEQVDDVLIMGIRV